MKTRSYPKSNPRSHDTTPVLDRVKATFDAKALTHNWRIVAKLAGTQSILPMIKANAYGHGAEWVARTLISAAAPAGEGELAGFGVASFQEGMDIRSQLGLRLRKQSIVVFSDAADWNDDKGQLCEEFGLTPVISSDDDYDRFMKSGWPGRIPYELKFNTGMNRLGISFSHLSRVERDAKQWGNRFGDQGRPRGILTHHALGEDPEHPLSKDQRRRMAELKGRLSAHVPTTAFHSANSATLWNARAWGLEGLTDRVRPGLALYGIPPWKGAPDRGLRPVATVWIRVVQVQTLGAGDWLGYGGTFRADRKMRVAILAAGYADGVHRRLSSSGHVMLKGHRERVLGRISMDLMAVSADAGVQVGDFAQLLGPETDPWEQSEAAGTIPYELLTSLSARVQRYYGDGGGDSGRERLESLSRRPGRSS